MVQHSTWNVASGRVGCIIRSYCNENAVCSCHRVPKNIELYTMHCDLKLQFRPQNGELLLPIKILKIRVWSRMDTGPRKQADLYEKKM
jgi:hypothetical protein